MVIVLFINGMIFKSWLRLVSLVDQDLLTLPILNLSTSGC